MGYLHQGVCYPDLPIARAQVCSEANRQSNAGTDLYTAACTSTDFDLATYVVTVQLNDAPGTAYTLSYPAFALCEHTYSAELSLLWMGAALLLFVTLFGFKHLYNLFSGRLDE